MNKNEKILSSQFFEMLGSIAEQLITKRTAICLGKDMGTELNSKAKSYFSFVIRPAELPENMAMLSLLSDVSSYIESNKGCVYTLFINFPKIEGTLYKNFLSIILSHEICHFVFLYELFTRLDENTDNSIHEKFINIINQNMSGKKLKENTHNMTTNELDNYSMQELIKNLEKFSSNEHFTNGVDSQIDYKSFFYDFLGHLDSLLKKI